MAHNLGSLVKGLSRADAALVGRLFDVLHHELNRDLDPAWRAEQARLAAEKAAREEARGQRDLAVAREEAVYFTSAEFREEVITELMDAGCTRQQAEGRTRDQARLFAEAEALGLK